MIPYLGCKQSFASEILANIPAADNFYDLFGGGGSVIEAAHRCRENGLFGEWVKWKYLHYNEINKGVCRLCRALWAGRFDFKFAKAQEPTKERYYEERRKPTAWGAFVSMIWSFGNRDESFIYASKSNVMRHNEHLQRIKRMEKSPILPDVEMYCKDYRDVKIACNSVVYCDIPYQVKNNHCKTKIKFNHLDFYEWAASRKFPVYFSEYDCFDKRFQLIWNKCVPAKINRKYINNKTLYKIEKLFWNGVKNG